MNNLKQVTAEHVRVSHPDKLSDYISDSLITAYLKQDPMAHTAIETLVTKNNVVIAGEVSSTAEVDKEAVVRKAIKEIGYIHEESGFCYSTVKFTDLIHTQSPDIAQGVEQEGDIVGSGDQGIMFGFASNATKNLMPLEIDMAKALTQKLTDICDKGETSILLPDGKSQVTALYDQEGNFKGIDTIVISNAHVDIDPTDVRQEILEKVIFPVLADYDLTLQDVNNVYINPTGKFTVYGPTGDTGLTGRKIVVDQYGPSCPVGGGAFSGKDATKTDRSAAYAARWVAKNIVEAKLATKCEVALSYAIGVEYPISIAVDTRGELSKEEELKLCEAVRNVFDLSPAAIIKQFNLRNINFANVVKTGAFGNDLYPWEQTDMVSKLQAEYNK